VDQQLELNIEEARHMDRQTLSLTVVDDAWSSVLKQLADLRHMSEGI
jgi:hypothetical protein